MDEGHTQRLLASYIPILCDRDRLLRLPRHDKDDRAFNDMPVYDEMCSKNGDDK